MHNAVLTVITRMTIRLAPPLRSMFLVQGSFRSWAVQRRNLWGRDLTLSSGSRLGLEWRSSKQWSFFSS